MRDLADEDLPSCTWAGTSLHLRQVAGELERARRDEVDYLAVCPPSDIPGTVLIRAAEERIQARDWTRPRSASRRPTRGRSHCTSGWAT